MKRRAALAAALGCCWPAARALDLAPDTQILERLRALRPNEAITLGRARVLGEFNDTARRFDLHRTGPRSRDFSVKMAWAPERRRALYAGANHGVPHRLNDVWEFDLAALAWVLLYAPDLPRSYGGLGDDPSDVEFKDGQFITRRGGPAIIAHSWWGLAYDSDRRRLLFMNTWFTRNAMREFGRDPSEYYAGPPLWAFDPAARRWQALKTEPPYPRAPLGGLLEYVPSLHGAVWHANTERMRASWLYLTAENRWRALDANAGRGDFQSQAPRTEQVSYHDPQRGLLIAQRGTNTYHFDIAARRWKEVLADGDAAPAGHDARTPLYHDPASGHGLLVDLPGRALWAYDPDRNRWTRLQPQGSPMPAGKRMLAYMDPARNVLVVIDDTTVWAWRYRVGPM